MKILNFGSINVDIVFAVEHIVRAGETIPSTAMHVNPGGKGANQSVACARAGATVRHAGMVGKDTQWMVERLRQNGVDTTHIVVSDDIHGGQAFIQVDASGQNSILLFGGANQAIPDALIDDALKDMSPGDWLVLQNEINLTPLLITAAHQAGLNICLNPSPMTPALENFPLELVTLFMLNEIEAAELARMPADTPFADIMSAMETRFPHAAICMTLGEHGACYSSPETGRLFQKAYPAHAVDTTAAGDTFTGYFLAATTEGQTPQLALDLAARAAAITVSRHGAMDSIPYRYELP